MGRLFQKATERSSLKSAWHRIKANGQTSAAAETRVAIEMFGRDLDRNIHKIQRRLRSDQFEFDPQQGVLKTKASGGKRGIVMASVQNRIVERAWLDCLQSASAFVRKVINQPTSVGGVALRRVRCRSRAVRSDNYKRCALRRSIPPHLARGETTAHLGAFARESGEAWLISM